MENIVITGVTSGFGVNWLYQLDSAKNAVFYVLGRDEEKFNRMIKNRELANKSYFIQCDLDSIQSINNAVESVKSLTDSIDLLINNAGVWSTESICMSPDNIEMTLAVNQLAPFLLSGQLLPLLKNSKRSHIINTASFRHRDAKVNYEDIELKNNFDAETAYCNSKLYSILFTKKLANMLEGTQVKVSCFDPGIVDTPMLQQAFPQSLKFIYPFFKRFIARTPAQGAATGVFLSLMLSADISSGSYFKNNKAKQVSKQANDNSIADWLWAESERLTGFKYA
ncbi:MAG: SDR family NAD(P)-dependent oxidoreductase [Colwellia sp.]|nr:SDR family NAD(P)-dependent oxidoreductase [Colwellia sp.]